MDNYVEWINCLLSNSENNPAAIGLIENCGKGCAVRQNAFESIEKLREAIRSRVGIFGSCGKSI